MTDTQAAKPPSSPSLPTSPPSLSEADLVKRINEAFDSMASAFRNSTRRAIEVGELLKEAKDRVKHGNFEEWLRIHCKLSFSTARRYMNFADHRAKIEEALSNGSITLNGKSVSVTDLSLSAAKTLIEHTPPPPSSTTLNGEEQKSKTKHREPSQKQKLKRVEDFKKTWEEFEDWQRRKFLKSFKERIAELLDELESEVEAA